MAYSDFTLEKVIDQLGVELVQEKDLFANVQDREISTYLTTIFGHNSAFSIESEKARSEKLIAPILDDVFSIPSAKFTIFSGENFDVDNELKLKGLADYLICLANTRYVIQAPIIALAESKRHTASDGLGQCVAELVAAAIFNERKNKTTSKLFGITTNGNEWMFAEYLSTNKTFIYDPNKYSLDRLPRIIGILTFMRDEALRMYDKSK